VNGKYRIATEKLKFAMPETGIGFFTDVGGSYFLSRCPEKVGYYLGLTGSIINAADAHHIGLVDKIINSTQMPDLLNALVNAAWLDNSHDTVNQVLNAFISPEITSSLTADYSMIHHCFSQPSVEEIILALKKESNEWSQQTAQLLGTRSPTSLKVVLEQLNRGALLDFDACMQMEYHIACHFLTAADFYEGIRAAVIDKDRTPHWQPATLEEVDASMVGNYFPGARAAHPQL
jgi:enoyl-CoA hydratase/carnithine racemase